MYEAGIVKASVACKWGALEEPVFGLPPEDVRVSLCYHVSAPDAAKMRSAECPESHTILACTNFSYTPPPSLHLLLTQADEEAMQHALPVDSISESHL